MTPAVDQLLQKEVEEKHFQLRVNSTIISGHVKPYLIIQIDPSHKVLQASKVTPSAEILICLIFYHV